VLIHLKYLQAQKTCTDEEIARGSCSFDCPALNNMILEEFSFQVIMIKQLIFFRLNEQNVIC